MRLLQSLVVAFATARNVRENFIPDKIYVDEMCREKGPGAYTYSSTKCDHYVQCGEKGHAHHVMPCPPGLLYNEDLGWCDYAQNVPPPCGDKPDGKPDDEECSKGDGFYPNQLSCEEYFVCRNGQAMELKCPEKFGFDQVGKICTVDAFVSSYYCHPDKLVYGNPVTTQATAFCEGMHDGNYAHPGFCHGFIKCWSGLGSEFICPNQRIWNNRLKICDHPAFVRDNPCALKESNIEEPEMNALEFCSNKNQEGLFEFPGDCESFAQCYQVDGKIVGAKKDCPTGLVFNADLGICDWPENVSGVCHNGKTPYHGTESIEIPDVNDEVEQIATNAKDFCAQVKIEGTFRDPNDCSVFFVCQSHGRADKFHCPQGLVYNEEKNYCDYADNLKEDDSCWHVNLYSLAV